MNWKETAEMIHQNAVRHGWWETERPGDETIALIHSEWSEALEEARMGRPMEYRMCQMEPEEPTPCAPGTVECGREPEGCRHREQKPEGVAVELMDGVIRILDYLGKTGFYRENPEAHDYDCMALTEDAELPSLVTWLHALTSQAFLMNDPMMLHAACVTAMRWVDARGLDAERVLTEKHRYNEGRPYKHGKKF